ncbi:MAG: transcription-repair coupling factor [Flavobacteriaceae bacterium]|nr:transcription-repair coupling factor [Flavobacteriaceae bacterium]
MNFEAILELYKQHPSIVALNAYVSSEKNSCFSTVTGLSGSALSFALAAIFQQTEKPILLILEDKENAAFYLNDLESMLGEKRVLFYPSSYRRPYQIEETDNANVLLRAEVINHIHSKKKPAVVVTYPEALFEKVITKKELDKNTLKISVGDALSIDFVNEVLFEYKFHRVDFVSEPGEFSVRGGILDVFSFSNNEPYRIEFFGNEVESIRTFDIADQLSLKTVKKIQIIPNVENKTIREKRDYFLSHVSPETNVFTIPRERVSHALDTLFQKAVEAFGKLSSEISHATPEELFCDGKAWFHQLDELKTFELNYSENAHSTATKSFDFHTKPQLSFNKQFELFGEFMHEKNDAGFKNYIFCSNEQQVHRFHDIFEDIAPDVSYQAFVFPAYQGFIDEELKIVCYTDHQFFERYHKFHLKNGYAKKQTITLKEFNSLQVGDYVTHIDHGVGKFGGLQKIDVEGQKQEAIKLIYGDNDILYLSIHSLHKISKYNGKDGKPPKVYKLGSGAWKALKQKTKTRLKQLAFDLIALYAKRKTQKGHPFAPDSYLQHELEASFIYEDTPDQFKATQDVKADMESERSMDRLVCGDVGFGKTEVAVRAAFKAVDNSKQVAVLVPTTILAFQHYKTFSERLKGLPVSVDYMNRFRTAKERKKTLEDLASGKLDIVIGTHQLISKEVIFKDLGLLIVDEEQKFGVSVKEKLKTIKANVDTLTLTATPIPRTLQFSLMGARDLSTITTPPPNRYPIETQVVRFSEELIRDAIRYEMERGGQVFFVNNRIENIKEVAGLLQRLVPDAKIGIGHGQMDGKKLEALMLDFMNGHFDVLISTSIIENGLDVPNANTIIVNNANHFGISDLHQIRGRVGRSNKKAFCYLITPPYHMMTDEARKRLTALEQFSDLGSGINIAMKDLEIRGAGDLLGAEQSGFINEMGFETYQKILQEAVEELRENEYKELFQPEENTRPKDYVKDVQIDTDFELLFPDEYVNSISERVNLYQQLAEIKDEEGLAQFEIQLADRFGPLPKQAKELLLSMKIKWLATRMGLEKVIMKKGGLIGYFIAEQDSPFYQTTEFSKLLQNLYKLDDATVKEKQTRNGLRLLLTIEKVKNLKQALKQLTLLQKNEMN